MTAADQVWALLFLVVAPAVACVLVLAWDWVVGTVVLDAPDALEVDQTSGGVL